MSEEKAGQPPGLVQQVADLKALCQEAQKIFSDHIVRHGGSGGVAGPQAERTYAWLRKYDQLVTQAAP